MRSVRLSRRLCLLLAGFWVSTCLHAAVYAEWKPKQAPLMTRWAKDVDPARPLPEYPRPQLVRQAWQNLNGLWNYAIRPKNDAQPTNFDGDILVPFPVESALSGVMQSVGADKRLWYRRSFEIPAQWSGQNVLLHFGAVDWETSVWVNGKSVGLHRGGYDPFTFDITDALKSTGPQELIVDVWDPTTRGSQPVGKQHDRPEGIWYTPTTGIWQTVWLEPVPRSFIRGLKITPQVDTNSVVVEAQVTGQPADGKIAIDIGLRNTAAGQPVRTITATGAPNQPIVVSLGTEPAALWSPDAPVLHDLTVKLLTGPAGGTATVVDAVGSYFGQRKSSIGPDENGVTRILLNNKPLFQFGPLDQGFWPDGLYTAPTDEALKSDIEITKQYGFNMARKHVKVEPARWYYWCDKLGLLVWQDMPSSADGHIAPGRGEGTRPEETVRNFERELKALIDTHRNVPSIVMWVPFNEGWGQFDTVRIAKLVKDYDPTRLVNCASGWNDFPAGDVHDIHVYPGPASPKPETHRAAVLGEYGGLGLPLPGHTWQNQKNWGYRSFTSVGDLTAAYLQLTNRLRPLVGSPGLSAAVYTQTTDVEIEVNGLLTYDRAVAKLKPEVLAPAHRRVYGPPPRLIERVPTSQTMAQEWKFTFDKPADNWFEAAFDDTGWKAGPGGFGTRGTPGSQVRTEWKSNDVWIRRSFTLDEKLNREHLQLVLHHDEDAEVYLNGVLAVKAAGYTSDYQWFDIAPAARQALKAGRNTLAIHCRQTGGGQYIDAGLIEFEETTVK
ncbi:MAG: glycoside hydrolase family 2 [Planctomycetes bacterium]|nr:glycoside hydrolase family 2 [Planctomycetota bacterium]